MKKFFKVLFISLFSLIIVSIVSFLIYANIYYKAADVDKYMTSDLYVEVTETNDYIAFMPTVHSDEKVPAGYIFYPGAKVEEKAYSELMYEVAKNSGIFTVIVKMPLRFAFFDINKANKVMDAYKEKVNNWYIGGHSLGGAMATSYLEKNQDKFQGFILLGAYTTADFSSNENLWGMTIYGSNDYVLNRNSYAKAKDKMPKHNFEYVVEGGNHANFASYGKQKGDGEATITKDRQIALTALKMIEFIGAKQLTLLI